MILKMDSKLNLSQITRVSIRKKHIEIDTMDGWRLPVKHNISRHKADNLLQKITKKQHTDQHKKPQSVIQSQSKDDVNHKTNTCWNRMVGIIFDRKQIKIKETSVQIARKLSKMMAPKRKFIFNKKTKQMGKILIDTWEARLTMEKEGLVISVK
jgi:hypothetical protein